MHPNARKLTNYNMYTYSEINTSSTILGEPNYIYTSDTLCIRVHRSRARLLAVHMSHIFPGVRFICLFTFFTLLSSRLSLRCGLPHFPLRHFEHPRSGNFWGYKLWYLYVKNRKWGNPQTDNKFRVPEIHFIHPIRVRAKFGRWRQKSGGRMPSRMDARCQYSL